MSKKISINPEYFKMSVKKGKKKKKKPSFKESQLKPNDVKKKLIARIKEHQQKEKERELLELDNKTKTEDANFKNEFKDTMDYLEELNKKKKKKRKKNKTIKNKTIKNRHNSGQNDLTHGGVDVKPMNYRGNSGNSGNSASFSQSSIIKQPPYGILKNGSKPTYRQWKKTLKKSTPDTQSDSKNNGKISINTNSNNQQSNNQQSNNQDSEIIDKFDFTDRKQKLDYIKNKLRVNEPQKRKIKTRRVRRKITLGKYEGKVGVLVKNKRTRKIIKNEVHVLKKKPINEIKEYLRKHNLMKIGSAAPDNICRGTYESAFLSGDVYNKNTDILLHNWNEGDEKN